MAELAGGGSPASPEDLLACLRELRVEHHTVRHPPVFTVAEAKALRGDLPGGHTKNLFLRNNKGRMWLVTCREDLHIRLDELATALQARRLSFASPERLMRYLGVIPGAVTPFALINDRGGAVDFVLDHTLLDFDVLNVHPLDNARTTVLRPQGLLRFLERVAHPPRVFDLSRMIELESPAE